MNSDERYSRQKQIVPLELLSNYSAPLIVGVGAIGRNVAIQLAAIGVENLTLVDFDVVEESNISSQGFFESNIEKHKVEAVKETCLSINSQMKVNMINSKFKRSMQSDIIFCCVDSISVRKFIWDTAGVNSKFFIDGRMSAEVFRIITIDKQHYKELYPLTLFSEDETFIGSCTAKSTVYCSNIAAGFMIQSFTKWLREYPNDLDITYNLLSNDLIVNENHDCL